MELYFLQHQNLRMNKKEANRRKRLKQQEEGKERRAKKRLKAQILHFTKMKRLSTVALLMNKYKSKYEE